MVRPHGVRGEVVVEMVTNRRERLAPGASMTAGGRELTVVTARPVPGSRDRERFVVAFEGVDGRHSAEALRGATLLAAAIDDPGAWWVHQLVGCQVQSTAGGTVGEVVAVQSNPASDLLVLDDGALIPLRFVVDRGDGWLKVDLPPGLLEL